MQTENLDRKKKRRQFIFALFILFLICMFMIQIVFGSVLHFSASVGNVTLTKFFIFLGSDINKRGSFFGWTPLHAATAFGQYHTAKLLINKRADLNKYDMTSNETPLHTAVSMGNYEIADLLLQNGADVNATAWDSGGFPIHYAVKHGDIRIVKLLVKHGAFINLQWVEHKNKTPLALAKEYGYRDIEDYIRENGGW